MPAGVNYARVEKKSLAAVRARNSANKHAYFVAVAHVRYILRKVVRMVDDKASELGLGSLEHQALLQVYGSATQQLRVNELAERLDIAPPFASNLVKDLIKRKLLKRASDSSDLRVTVLQITNTGRELCHRIDAEVRPHVDYFTSQLTEDERETALSTLMFYVGPGTAGAREG
jgi:DNA-binding MarR family transcriptional regulator